MVTRKYLGRRYRIILSTEKRLGVLLLAIKRADDTLKKIKRKRIIRENLSNISEECNDFERGLMHQIKQFKQRKK